ncbi:MAG: hypothetical protein IJY72_08635 [Akkermansia sp.]|nr:hypothetical protein [Akkermansia sp.]
MPTIVTPSQADTVLEVNRANAIKQAVSKVKAKKPLSKAEVELLQSIAYSSEQGGDPSITETSTIVDLAAALGVSRRSISNWRKMEGAPVPKSNGNHDVIAWRRFIHEHHLDGSSPGDEEGLKIRKLLAEINEREFRLAVRKGEYILKDLVREAWLSRCGRVVNLLRSKFEKEMPPQLAGLTAPDIQELLSKAIDEVLQELHEGKGDSLTP